MPRWNRTSREVDGEQIEGSWRHAFINNGGTYFLTDVIVYADGLIECWGLVTLEEFRDKLRSGWVATSFDEGARASAYEVASWRFADVRSSVSADELYAEVVDEIESLNGRPDASGKCWQALDAYLADRTDSNRRLLADAYEAIPRHRRAYILGDQDARDRPLRTLIGGSETVTEEQRAAAFAYFAERGTVRQRSAARTPATSPAVVVPGTFHHRGWPDPPGLTALHPQYPAPVRIGGITYPTVEHAYWALRTTDASTREAVLAEDNTYGLPSLAAASPARDGWDECLQATITQLLRAKFQQHERLADELLATGNGRIVYEATGFGDAFAYDTRRHLIGRLLELVRSEQRAWRSGLLDLGVL